MKARILVIDDEEPVRQTLRQLLEMKGYRVDSAADALEGRQKARENQFAVILLDYMMPQKSGIEAIPDLRQASPGAAILMLTAFGTVEAAKEAMKKGADDFLLKPIEPPALYEAVERATSSRRTAEPQAPDVLLVEDDSEMSRMFAALLEKEGYRVAVSLTGSEALDQARARAFDILLVDVRLPDMDGLQVVERALTYHETKPTAILMTGQPTIPGAVRAAKVGAVEYLSKPVEPEALLALLARETAKRRWTSLPEGIQPGKAYLVLDEAGERTRGVFQHLVSRGLRGIAFSRDPSAIPRTTGVQTVAMGASKTPDTQATDPAQIFAAAETYCRTGPAVVLLDGLEYLTTRAGFTPVLTTIQSLRDLAASTGSLLLCPVSPSAFGDRELALLKRELRPLDLQSPIDRVNRWKQISQGLPPDKKTLYDILIEASGNILQSDLTDKCGFSRAKVSRLLDQLEDNKLVLRRREGMGNRVLLT